LGSWSKKDNNGAIILVKIKTADSDGKVNISTGYGLEEYVPDGLAKRIIEKEMIPAFKQNDYYTGIDNAVNAIMGLASGAFTADEYAKDDVFPLVILLFIMIFMLSVIFRSGKKTLTNKGSSGIWKILLLASLFNNHNNHNDFGGGFGGGNSDFGGGGFGGFGGGSFGGGGASGSW
jgi:Beta-propeller domains of methanol dehydrogenase type